MAVTKDRKAELVKKYGKSETDTGATEVQIALLTERVVDLTEHLKTRNKDNHTRYGLLKLVGQRRALLDYLQKKEASRYRAVVKNLGLRK